MYIPSEATFETGREHEVQFDPVTGTQLGDSSGQPFAQLLAELSDPHKGRGDGIDVYENLFHPHYAPFSIRFRMFG